MYRRPEFRFRDTGQENHLRIVASQAMGDALAAFVVWAEQIEAVWLFVESSLGFVEAGESGHSPKGCCCIPDIEFVFQQDRRAN